MIRDTQAIEESVSKLNKNLTEELAKGVHDMAVDGTHVKVTDNPLFNMGEIATGVSAGTALEGHKRKRGCLA